MHIHVNVKEFHIDSLLLGQEQIDTFNFPFNSAQALFPTKATHVYTLLHI